MDALLGEGDPPLSRGQGSWLGGGRVAELYWGPQPWFRERHRIPSSQGPPPPSPQGGGRRGGGGVESALALVFCFASFLCPRFPC